jgi:signal transduction histidine kinase
LPWRGEARRAVLISLLLFVISDHGQATQDDATGSGELGKGWTGLGPSISRQQLSQLHGKEN